MDRLFAPWRHAYVTRKDEGHACIFCSALESAEGRSLVVFDGATCYIILNLYPYNSGHLMIVPRRHVGTLAALHATELVELAELTRRAEIALTEVYEPQGLNVGINLGKPAGAGVVDHLHVHLVPRWAGDTNFMSIVGNVRVLPEELPRSAARLRPVFERLAQ